MENENNDNPQDYPATPEGNALPPAGAGEAGEPGPDMLQKSAESSLTSGKSDASEPGPEVPAKSAQSSKSSRKKPSASPEPATKTRPKLVQRVTALRGAGIVPAWISKSTVRRNTIMDLGQRDPEIPYMKTETALRDLVCSILERQDRMNETIFNRIIDLEYRIDDIETGLLADQEKTGLPSVIK